MAHLLGTQSLGALAGSRQLLADVDISVEDTSRIGILGPNGAGKSTLLRLVAGMQQPDDGQVITRDGLRVVMLEQADHLDDNARVMDAVHPGLEEYEWASQSSIRDIHAGLLADIDLHALVGTLSGGQRRRVDLARVLALPSDVVCLDEPTNHLDVEGVAWLARHLNARFARPGASGALIAVTHDRWFLDAVCETIWEVVPGIDPGGSRPQIPGRVEIYDGSYAAYTLARAERVRQADVAAKKRANLLTKELAWLRRGAPARTSKPKFHIAAAEALIADVPPPRDSVELVKMATARLGKDVVDLEDVSVSFETPQGGRRTILDHVTWRLAPGERVGIVGVNGAGKTTILNLLRGDLEPTSGRVKRGKTVQIATLSQDTHELDELSDLRVVEAVDAVAHSVIVDGKEVSASQMTERMGFTRERAWTRVSEISGGERRRLQLMRLLMGTLVVVSHDRYLLERATDHQVALLGDGSLRALPGGVEEYLSIREAGGAKSPDARESAAGPRQSGNAAGEESPAGATGSGMTDSAARRAAKKESARLERKIDTLRARLEKVEEKLAECAARIAEDQSALEEMTDLSAQSTQIRQEIDELEEAWLLNAELLDE